MLVDDLTMTFVPEPLTILLAIVGLSALSTRTEKGVGNEWHLVRRKSIKLGR